MSVVTTPVMTDVTGRAIASAILASATVPAEVEIDDDGAVSQELVPNTMYHFTGDLTSLTITLGTASGIAQYHFDFISEATAPTLTLPVTVIMPEYFSIKANTRYEIDIINNYGVFQTWPWSAPVEE